METNKQMDGRTDKQSLLLLLLLLLLLADFQGSKMLI